MSPVRIGTYSIVARDPEGGAIGVAVQSHWFSVGSVVSWGRAGVGAVATQSIAEPAYGPRLLAALEAGERPQAALDRLTGEDDAARFRQVAVVDSSGEVAVHTGDGCIEFAGHVSGDGFSVQANMMSSPDVWPAMAKAYSAARGSLARRLLAALEAGEAAGGDVRGRQSAALLVVPADGDWWLAEAELRVEDHPEPLAELSRLLDLHDAYALASEGDDLTGQGRGDEAADRYRRAAELAPDNEELQFWGGLSLMQSGELEEGMARVRRVMEANDGWRQLLLRLDEVAPGIDEARRVLGIEGEEPGPS
jgi:uncharacterized Ntn-hydrolase superfamily protein